MKMNYSDYFKTRKYHDEKKDNDAMDIDAMSTEKRITLMKKGACFICEKPGHMARDHDKYVKKARKENAYYFLHTQEEEHQRNPCASSRSNK